MRERGREDTTWVRSALRFASEQCTVNIFYLRAHLCAACYVLGKPSDDLQRQAHVSKVHARLEKKLAKRGHALLRHQGLLDVK